MAGLFAQGPERLEQALEFAQNATGSALREHERSMDGVAFKAQTAANEMTKFWQTTINVEFIKMFYDSLANIARGITAVSNSIGMLPVILGLATAGILLFTVAGKGLYATLLMNITTIGIFATALKGVTVSTGFATAAFMRLNFSLLAVMTTLGAITAFLLPIAAIVGITYGITKLTSVIMKNREEVKNLEEQNQRMVRTWTTQNEKIEELISTYEQLSKLKDEGSLSLEDEQEYLSVQNELAEMLPNLVDNIDAKGQAHLKSTKAIKEELVYLEKLTNLEKQRQVATFTGDISSIEKDIKEKEKEIQERNRSGYVKGSEKYEINESAKFRLMKEIADLEKELTYKMTEYASNQIDLSSIKLDDSFNSALVESIKNLDRTGKSVVDVKNEINNLIDVFDKLSKTQTIRQDEKNELESNKLEKEISELEKVISQKISENLNDVGKSTDEVKNEINDLIKIYDELNIKKASLSVLKFDVDSSEFKKALEDFDFNPEQFEKIKNAYKSVADEANKTANAIVSAAGVERKAIEIFEKSAETMSELNKIIEDVIEGKNLTADATANIISKYPELIDAIEIENGVITINKEAVIDLKNTKLESFRIQLEAEKNALINSGEMLKERLKHIGLEIEGIKTLDEVRTQKLKNVKKDADNYFSIVDKLSPKAADWLKNQYVKSFGDLNEDETGLINEYLRIQQESIKTEDAIGKVNKLIGMVGAGKGLSGVGNKSPKSGSGSKDEFSKELDLSNRKIEEKLHLIEKLNDALEDATTYEQKATIYEQLIQEHKSYLDLLNLQKNMQKEILSDLIAQIKASKVLTDEQKKQILEGDFAVIDFDGDKYKDIIEVIDKFDSLSTAILATEKAANGVDNTIRDTISNSLDNLYNKLNTTFNELENKIKTVNNEMSLLQDYQVDEKAEKTKTLFDLYEQQVNAVILNVKRLNEEFNNLTKKGLDENSDAWKKNKEKLQEWLDMGFNVSGMVKDLIDQIANEVIEIYKETYKQQEKIASDSIDKQIKAEEKRHKKVMDDLEKETNAFEELINAKLRLIEDKSDEEDYDRELAKKQKEEQDISNQINVLELDNSIEAKAKRTTLLKELAEKQEEIEIFMNERSKDLQKQNLKDQSDTYKKEVDLKKDAEDSKHDLIKENLEEEKEAIKLHYDNLINDERKFAQIKKDIISGNLDNIKTDFDLFAAFIKTNMEGIGSIIGLNLIDQINNASNASQGINYNIPNSTSPSTSNPNSPTTPSKQSSYTVDAWGHRYIVSNKGHTITKNGQYVPVENFNHLPSEVLDIARKMKIGELHDGGFVGNNKAPNKISELIHKLFNTKGNEQLTLALRDEFFTPQKNIINNFIPNMNKLVNSFAPQIPAVAGDNIYKLNINIENITGDKSGGQVVIDTIINGVNKLGGRFK